MSLDVLPWWSSRFSRDRPSRLVHSVTSEETVKPLTGLLGTLSISVTKKRELNVRQFLDVLFSMCLDSTGPATVGAVSLDLE